MTITATNTQTNEIRTFKFNFRAQTCIMSNNRGKRYEIPSDAGLEMAAKLEWPWMKK